MCVYIYIYTRYTDAWAEAFRQMVVSAVMRAIAARRSTCAGALRGGEGTAD